MAAIDDLTELVERAAAAERSALAAKWKDRGDVEATVRRVRKAAEDQREAIRLDGRGTERLSPRWAEHREAGGQTGGDGSGSHAGTRRRLTSAWTVWNVSTGWPVRTYWTVWTARLSDAWTARTVSPSSAGRRSSPG